MQSIFWAPRVGVAYDIFGTGKTLLRGGFGVFNFHDAQGPYSGFIDLPYGVTFTDTTNVPLSQVGNVNPNAQPGLSGDHLRGRRQAAADAELELHRSAAHPVPDDGRSRRTSGARAITC